MRDVRAVPPVTAARARVPVMAGRWWAAVSGGRFYTWWSAAIALPVAVTVLGSFGGVQRPQQAAVAVVLSAAGWFLCVLLLLPAAWGERRLRRPGARATLVIGALVVVSAARPVLNDLLVSWWSPRVVGGDLSLRIAVNLVGWFVLLSMIAVAVNVTATAAGVNRRLREALAALAGADAADEGAARRARARILYTVAGLRRRADALRSGVVDFDRVREFSEAVREASHDLDERADGGVTAGEHRRAGFLEGLLPPPVGLVGVLFSLCSVPYAVSVMPPWMVVGAAIVVVGLAVLGDVLLRALVRRRTPRVRGVLIIAVSTGLGAVISLIFLPVFAALGMQWLIPLVAVPVLTTLAAIAEGAMQRAEVEQRSLTQALSAFRGSAVRRPSAVDLLRSAAAALHGEVQSRCVVFAATLDDDVATPAQTSDFIDAVGARLDRVTAPPPAHEEREAFAALIAAWSHVLDIRCDIDEASTRALADPDTGRTVADITSEAFVNAVKHSAAKEATVAVTAARPPADALDVRITTPGRLRYTRSEGRGLARLGVPARLTQRGRDVELAASVPYRFEAAQDHRGDTASA
jgi:hypothetical protein